MGCTERLRDEVSSGGKSMPETDMPTTRASNTVERGAGAVNQFSERDLSCGLFSAGPSFQFVMLLLVAMQKNAVSETNRVAFFLPSN